MAEGTKRQRLEETGSPTPSERTEGLARRPSGGMGRSSPGAQKAPPSLLRVVSHNWRVVPPLFYCGCPWSSSQLCSSRHSRRSASHHLWCWFQQYSRASLSS